MSNHVHFILSAIVFICVQSSRAEQNSTQTPVSSKPNIILMLADDLGYGEPRCYGNAVGRMPNFDRLAAAGARFTDGYATFNVCSPSRAALLVGRYPQRLGPLFEDYFGGHCPGLDPKRDRTLGQMAKEVGYATACFGKWNVSHSKISGPLPPNAFGFDRWVGLHLNHDYYSHRLGSSDELDLYRDGQPFDRPGVWSDTIFADEAIRFIEEHRERPFFIYLPWQAPHTPLQDPDVPGSAHAPSSEMESRPVLEKMIARLDLEAGRVIDAVKRNGLESNTVIIFTSDNGGSLNVGRNAPLRGWKQELWEGGIRVPLVVTWPGRIPAGRTIQTPVTHMDLTATLAGLMGASAAPDQPFDGTDLLPVLTGEKNDLGPRHLFWRRHIVKGPDKTTIKQSSVRSGNWTYIRSFQPVRGSGGGTYSSDYTEELFNLAPDIRQAINVATDEPARLAALQEALDGWEAEMSLAAAGSSRQKPVHLSPTASTTPDRAASFRRMDLNQDGYLSGEEFAPPKTSLEETRKRFQHFDKNADGKLSREEYLNDPVKATKRN
jgi:arylsulfatase A-like enzyme